MTRKKSCRKVTYGVVGAVYWTVAVAAVSMSAQHSTAPLFRAPDAFAGAAIGRYRPRTVHIGLFAATEMAIALLAGLVGGFWWLGAVVGTAAGLAVAAAGQSRMPCPARRRLWLR